MTSLSTLDLQLRGISLIRQKLHHSSRAEDKTSSAFTRPKLKARNQKQGKTRSSRGSVSTLSSPNLTTTWDTIRNRDSTRFDPTATKARIVLDSFLARKPKNTLFTRNHEIYSSIGESNDDDDYDENENALQIVQRALKLQHEMSNVKPTLTQHRHELCNVEIQSRLRSCSQRHDDIVTHQARDDVQNAFTRNIADSEDNRICSHTEFDVCESDVDVTSPCNTSTHIVDDEREVVRQRQEGGRPEIFIQPVSSQVTCDAANRSAAGVNEGVQATLSTSVDGRRVVNTEARENTALGMACCAAQHILTSSVSPDVCVKPFSNTSDAQVDDDDDDGDDDDDNDDDDDDNDAEDDGDDAEDDGDDVVNDTDDTGESSFHEQRKMTHAHVVIQLLARLHRHVPLRVALFRWHTEQQNIKLKLQHAIDAQHQKIQSRSLSSWNTLSSHNRHQRGLREKQNQSILQRYQRVRVLRVWRTLTRQTVLRHTQTVRKKRINGLLEKLAENHHTSTTKSCVKSAIPKPLKQCGTKQRACSIASHSLAAKMQRKQLTRHQQRQQLKQQKLLLEQQRHQEIFMQAERERQRHESVLRAQRQRNEDENALRERVALEAVQQRQAVVKQQMRVACLHHCRFLLVHIGWRPWNALVERNQHMLTCAVRVCDVKQRLRYWTQWRVALHERNAVEVVREDEARHWMMMKMQCRTLNVWRQYCRTKWNEKCHVQQRWCVYRWLHSMACDVRDARERFNVLLKRRSVRVWCVALHVQTQKNLVDAHKMNLWSKVRNWLDEDE